MPAPNSNASPIASIEIEADGRVTNIVANDFLQAIEIEASTNSAWTGQIRLYDRGGDRLEDVTIGSGSLPTVRFRFNWQEFGLQNAPLFEGIVQKPSFVWLPDGILITWEIMARQALLPVLDRKTRSFEEGALISDIVRQIAADRGWPTTDERGNPTIEDTATSIDHPFNTSDESDVKFIQQQLREQAVNADGVGGYAFYFDTIGAVHFHTANFTRPRVKRYVFGRDGGGEVIQFSPANTGVFAAILGAGKSVVRSTSSLDATQTATDGGVSDGLDGEGDVIAADAIAVPDLGNGVAASMNINARDSAEMLRLAKDRRERASRLQYTADLDVSGTHDVLLFDYINVQYIRRNGQPHFLSGNFLVQKIKHRYDNSGWVTTFGLTRAGLQPNVGGTVARQPAKTITPEEAS